MRVLYGLILITSLSLIATCSQQNAIPARATLEALEVGQQAVRAAPDSEAARISLASIYLKIGQNRNAVETLKPYLKFHPASPRTLRLLAVAYLQEEDYAAAKDFAERALRTGRDYASVQVLAMAELGLQTPESAERLFREALALNPDSAETNLQLGRLLVSQHKSLPEAISCLEKARSLQPGIEGVNTALGSAFLATGNPQKAVESLEKAVKLSRPNPESFYLLASAYRGLHEEGKAQSALDSFNVQTKAAADQRASEMRGRADYEEGVNLLSNTDQLDKASESFTKALNELPAFDPAYYRMAQILYLKGDLKGGLSSIRQALKLNPFEPEYYYVLARCLENIDAPHALQAIQKAVEIRPGVQDFEELLGSLKSKAALKLQ